MTPTMAIARNASVACGSLLMLFGIIWSIAAVVSPAWQVVNLREFQTEHEHGLWQDCARTFKTGVYQGALHCTYKFDYSPGQLVEANGTYDDCPECEDRYHQFYTFHVVFLLLIGASVFAGIIAIWVSFGTHCVHSRSDLSFLIIAHRNRFVKGIVGTYEGVIGRAFYFELVSCIFYLLAFICSLLTSYLSRHVVGSRLTGRGVAVFCASVLMAIGVGFSVVAILYQSTRSMHAWQFIIVGLIGAAVFSGVAALFVAYFIALFRLCVIVFTILAFLSVILSANASIIFYMNEVSYVNGIFDVIGDSMVFNVIEQMIHHSTLISFVCYLLSFLTSILASFLFLYHRDSLRSSKNRTTQRDAPLLSSFRPQDHGTTA